MLRTSYFKLPILRSSFVYKFAKFNFSTGNTPATANPGQGQVATPPTKTKEQIKVETLMQQWPEYLRNPPKGDYDLETAKEIYEDLYKYHQGDKKYLGPLDIPTTYAQDFNAVINQVQTTDAVADFFARYEGFLPEHFIMGLFQYLAARQQDKTPEFYDTILPQVKKLILNADRQTAKNLYIAVVSGSYLKLNDTEYWDMIVIY